MHILYIQKRTSILKHQSATLRFVSLGPLTFFPNGDLNLQKALVLWVDVSRDFQGKTDHRAIETWYRNIIQKGIYISFNGIYLFF